MSSNALSAFIANLGVYLHTQSTPASTWVITHNIGEQYLPVVVANSSGAMILPQSITFDSTTQTTITFASSITGYAAFGAGRTGPTGAAGSLYSLQYLRLLG